MELNYASWGGGGGGGSRILRWKMAVDGAGVIFKLPITRRGDTYLFEIPDRLIAIFQMAERFNSQTAHFENTITHDTVTQNTNSADKGDLKGGGCSVSIQSALQMIRRFDRATTDTSHLQETPVLVTRRKWRDGVSVPANVSIRWLANVLPAMAAYCSQPFSVCLVFSVQKAVEEAACGLARHCPCSDECTAE